MRGQTKPTVKKSCLVYFEKILGGNFYLNMPLVILKKF